MKGTRWRKCGPFGLIALAFVIIFMIVFEPNPLVNLGSIDLTAESIKEARFKVAYQERYDIGLKMSREVAERLYPCLVSPDQMGKPLCRNAPEPWRNALTMTISSGRRNLTNKLEPSLGSGGQYNGSSDFTWSAASIPLHPEEVYRLTVRSTGSISSLQLARPQLVVTAEGAPGFLESRGLLQITKLIIAISLLIVAGCWMMVNARSRGSAAP